MANYSVTVDTLASAMVPALTSADVPWTSEGARIIYDVNTSVQRIYAGDNPSGNAINKTGHHEIAAGVQLSMYPAAHGGLDGKGASTLTLQPGATLRNINYATFAQSFLWDWCFDRLFSIRPELWRRDRLDRHACHGPDTITGGKNLVD